jgi:hypothetical protein
MNKNVQVHNSVSFLKNESEPANVIRVTVSANGYSDETAIAIRPESSDYFDPATDAVKFYGSSLAPQIYTIKDDNSQLAISCVNSIDDVFGKVIYTDYAQNGEHVITWSHTLQSGIIPTLYDNVAGIAIPAETPYIYSASDTDPTDRFVLTETTMIMETMENDINILESNNVLYIQNFTNNQSGDVTIFNVHGQIVLQFTGSIKDLSSLAPAVYVVKVNAGENTVVEKVVVK